MLVPLFNLVTHRPDLIIDHLAGYLKLAQDEVGDLKRHLVRRVIAGAVALVFAVAFIVLAGMALMLWSIITNVQTQSPPVSVTMLVAVPAIALIAAIIAGVLAMKSNSIESPASLADHIQRDIQAFRQVIQAKEDGS